MPKTQIEPIRDPKADSLLTPENCAVVLIDYQPEQVATVRSSPIEEVMLNVKAVVKLARAYNVPVVLTTVGVDMGVNTGTIDELKNELPEAPEIDRTGVNSWEDEDFRKAVIATGRRKIVICGLWTEVCCAFPTLDMLREGFEIFPVIDAIGGISKTSHDTAITRMVKAGAQPVTAISFGSELMRNWARPTSDEFRKVLRWYFPEQHRIAVATAKKS
ncbi:MAG: isochorismatase family protein [Candidatus Competibacteraceae bacterium]|nr:isochorismatase family protein [Candidatus Competibacteraceae bacterium]